MPTQKFHKRGSKYKKVHEFDAHTDESEEEFFVIEDIDINHVSKKDEVHVILMLNKEPVIIKVDTGAKSKVMSRELTKGGQDKTGQADSI